MKKETKPVHRKLDDDELNEAEDTPPGEDADDLEPKDEKSRKVEWSK